MSSREIYGHYRIFLHTEECYTPLTFSNKNQKAVFQWLEIRRPDVHHVTKLVQRIETKQWNVELIQIARFILISSI